MAAARSWRLFSDPARLSQWASRNHDGEPMIVLLATKDPVKLSAVRAILARAAVNFQEFDAATGGLLSAAIPVRVMVAEDELPAARTALWAAGFSEAKDGDWDLA